MPWVYVALFVIFLALAATFVGLAGWLAQAGISRPVFFLVLIPAGLGTAAFLDRALRATSAEWVASVWFGQFRLGGSVAVFAMVVAAGVYVMPSSTRLQLLVRVRAPDAQGDPAPRGHVTLEAGLLSWKKEISPEGEAMFVDLPDRLRLEHVRLVPQIPGYQGDLNPTSFPKNGVLELMLQRQSSLVAGTVLTRDLQPLAGALVDFEHGLAKATTDALGHFHAELPRAPGASVLVMVLFEGKVGHQAYYSVPNELTLRFEP
jgi:hypothetical protein